MQANINWKNAILLTIAINIIIVLLLLVAGCTIVKYGGAEYASLGGKSFDKLRIIKDANSITVEVINFKKEGPMLVVEVPGLVVKTGGGQ